MLVGNGGIKISVSTWIWLETVGGEANISSTACISLIT